MRAILFNFILFVYTATLLGNGDTMIITCIKSGPVFKNPPFKSCHAATVVELGSSEIMAAWFGGTNEGSSDVCIWGAFYKNGKWELPVKLASGLSDKGKPLPCWNPVLFKSMNNTLCLFYKVGINPREWWGEVITSTDMGVTFSNPEKLPLGFLGPIKNKPLQLTSGEILYPSSTESSRGNIWKIHLELSDGNLGNWHKAQIDTFNNNNVIQPTLLLHRGGRLQMLCRSRNNVIMQTWSEDRGKTWGSVTSTCLSNPNSGIDAVTLSDSTFLLVYNPLKSGAEWYQGRNILKLAYSSDGTNWTDVYTFEDEREGEFSYPAIIQTSDKLVHVVYTANRKTIKHIVLQIKKMPK